MKNKNIIFGIVSIFVIFTSVAVASSNISSWIKYNENPVLELGVSGEWDDGHVEYPMVIKTDSLYEMWYTGGHIGPYSGNNKIGYASSTDGIHWNKYSGNPVLSTGSGWESYYVFSPSVIKDEGIYKMWYSGYAGGTLAQIGYATSIDGKSWTKHGSPVLSISPGEWDGLYVENPTVIKDESTYKMWYFGNDGSGGSIGYATSSDGIHWTKYSGNPVLQGVTRPKVLKDDSGYKMFYRGNYETYGDYRACFATSSDGITWTESIDNPILELGAIGTWDDYGTDHPMVIKDGQTYKMWYTGYDGIYDGNVKAKIGYATLELTVQAVIDVKPDTLNLNSKGKWITTYIEFIECLNVEDIDVSTIILQNQVQAEDNPTEIGDFDNDGIADLMLKFDRYAVQEILEEGDEVEITITGELFDGTSFEGNDTIRIIDNGKGK